MSPPSIPREISWIGDALNACRIIMDATRVGDSTRFIEDTLFYSAIMYQLLIIGEAVKRLPDELRDRFSAVPWKKITGLRDVAIHQYDGLNTDELWVIASKDIPVLAKQLEDILAVLTRESEGA